MQQVSVDQVRLTDDELRAIMHRPDVSSLGLTAEELTRLRALSASTPTPPSSRRDASVTDSTLDRLVSALPEYGGMIGGLAGGKSTPAGVALSGIGGMTGEAARHAVEAVRGNRVAPSLLEQIKLIMSEGAQQMGYEGLGRYVPDALVRGGKRMYESALKVPRTLRTEFGDAAEVGIREGIPVTPGASDVAQSRLSASSAEADQLINNSVGQPGRVDPPPVMPGEVLREFAPAGRDAAQAVRGGKPDVRPEIVARGKQFAKTNADGLSVPDAQKLKRTMQDAANEAFRAADRGGHVVSLVSKLDKATAEGLRKAIESRIPQVGPINRRTQALMGLMLALENAEGRIANNLPGILGARAAIGSTSGLATGLMSGDPSLGAAVGLGSTVGAMPGPASRGGIAMDRVGRALQGHGDVSIPNLMRLIDALLFGETPQ